MIGGYIGNPIGGLIPVGSEIFDREVSASVAATVHIRRRSILTFMVEAVVGPDIVKAVAGHLQAALDAMALARKSAGKYLSASATAGASILKQAGNILSTGVHAAASVVTGLGFFRSITAHVGAVVSERHAIGKTTLVPLAVAASARRAVTTMLSAAGVSASARVLKRAGKMLVGVVAASVTRTIIKARTLDLVMYVAASAGIRRRAGKKLLAGLTAEASVIKQAGKRLSAGIHVGASLLAAYINFFRPRRVIAGIKAGRGRGSIRAGSARTRIED